MDGEGTTEECLLNPNRNPHLTKAQVGGRLKSYLGARKVIWLERGIVPDPITDGRVDGLCAFVGLGRCCCILPMIGMIPITRFARRPDIGSSIPSMPEAARSRSWIYRFSSRSAISTSILRME